MIDKLYFIRKEFKVKDREKITDKSTNRLLSSLFGTKNLSGSYINSFEEYDTNKSPLENSEVAINNMIFHLMQKRLSDKETLESRITPGSFIHASEGARYIRELELGDYDKVISNGNIDFNYVENHIKEDPEFKPNYDYTDPVTMLNLNQQNQIAAKVIGIFANHNINTVYRKLLKECKLSTPIEFAGKSLSDFINTPVDTEQTMAEFLAASVDAVKDPVLNYLGINTLTANCAGLLGSLGYSMRDIGVLLRQPIVKQICDYAYNNDTTLDIALTEVLRNNYGYKNPLNKVNISQSDVSFESLSKNIVNGIQYDKTGQAYSNSFIQGQVQVAKLFSNVFQAASQLSKFIQATKFTAANSVGSTFGDMYSQQYAAENFISSITDDKSMLNIKLNDAATSPLNNTYDISNAEDYMAAMINNPFAMEQCMYDANKQCLNALASEFPYDRQMFKDARNTLRGVTKNNFIDAETINAVHRDAISYALSNCVNSKFNGDLIINNKGKSQREYYLLDFPKLLSDKLSSDKHLNSMEVFRNNNFSEGDIYIDGTKHTDALSFNIAGFGANKAKGTAKDEIMQSWAELARSNNPEYRQLAEDLFIYCFYRSGFNYNYQSFMDLAPVAVKSLIKVPTNDGSNVNRTYKEFLEDIQNGTETINNNLEFCRQFILNHLDNYLFTKEVKGKYLTNAFNKYAMSDTNYLDSFTIDINNLDSNSKNIKNFILAKSDDKGTTLSYTFTPVIKLGRNYYMANYLTSTNSSKVTYTKVNPLGKTNISSNYYSNYEGQQGTSIQGYSDVETKIDTSKEEANQISEFNSDVDVEDAIARAILFVNGKSSNSLNVKSVKRSLKNSNLENKLSEIRQKLKEKGCYILNEKGEIVKSC